MTRLLLTRPLAFFDIESTGVDPLTDRIVEISVLKLVPGTEDLVWTRRVNPNRAIPPAATAVHGISDLDVRDEPRFYEIAYELRELLDGCDLAGFGVRGYDIPLLLAEYERADITVSFDGCVVIDAKDIFHKMEPRTLSAAHLRYVGREIDGAHGAAADTMASKDVLLAMIEQYGDLPADVAGLAKVGTDPDAFDPDGKLKWADGELVVNFGKMKGKSLRELARIDRGYLAWMTRGAFSKKVVACVGDALRGKFPERVVEA